jgi:Uma2 family endonuclease
MKAEQAMSVTTGLSTNKPIIYPDSDGQPMADNTLQYEWIVTIKGNLDILFADRDDVFVAGDLLWYPVEGRPDIRRAPDAMVAFGRPKGYRGSYKQWVEANIAPQVAFEVLSPGNTKAEMERKFAFYQTYGVEEYYLYDPDHNRLRGWLRKGGQLQPIATIDNWRSPRLGITFRLLPDTLRIEQPAGQPFMTILELHARANQAEQAQQIAEQARQVAEQRAEELVARLRALGLEP